jgi:hypothetical protein
MYESIMAKKRVSERARKREQPNPEGHPALRIIGIAREGPADDSALDNHFAAAGFDVLP